jgi:uncharacterized membrane protein
VARRLLAFRVRRYLIAFLAIQLALLVFRLDLLPAWTDEYSTLETAPRSLSEIAAWARGDVHPPLYFFLLHFWYRLPLPGSPLTRLRAVSVLFTLLATCLLDRLWLRRLPTTTRLWFLALWVTSPCLILYARMARSYTAQVAVAAVAFYASSRWLERAGEWRRFLLCAGTLVLTLYVHYIPGGAILVALNVCLAWRALREGKRLWVRALLALDAAVAIGTLPWWYGIWASLHRWSGGGFPYRIGDNVFFDTLAKLAYWFVSFSFGEALPVPTLLAAVALTPLMLYFAWRGLQTRPDWLPLVIVATIVGFVGVARWVSFPFVPARLMFLLPFYLLLVLEGCARHRRARTVFCLTLLLTYITGLYSYYTRAAFLNKGYAAPFDEIASLVKNNSPPATLVVIDPYNTDAFPLRDRIPQPSLLLDSQATLDRILAELRRGDYQKIWHLRTTHDLSPGGLNRRLERELSLRCAVRSHLFLPYSVLERWVIRLLGWPEQPSHYYHVLEATGCRVD